MCNAKVIFAKCSTHDLLLPLPTFPHPPSTLLSIIAFSHPPVASCSLLPRDIPPQPPPSWFSSLVFIFLHAEWGCCLTGGSCLRNQFLLGGSVIQEGCGAEEWYFLSGRWGLLTSQGLRSGALIRALGDSKTTQEGSKRASNKARRGRHLCGA